MVDSLHGKYLNQGALQTCSGQTNGINENGYCQFERHLRQDMAFALGLEEAQFVVLFVKEADMQSVIVTFELYRSSHSTAAARTSCGSNRNSQTYPPRWSILNLHSSRAM